MSLIQTIPAGQTLSSTPPEWLSSALNDIDTPALPVAGVAGPITVKIASTQDEWQQALRLVAGCYERVGYQQPGSGAYRFTPYHALPDTVVCLALKANQVVATLTLIPDNWVLGLPLEKVYPMETAALRHQGHRMVEVNCLAAKSLTVSEFMPVFSALTKLAWQYSVAAGGDTPVIALSMKHPMHRLFYRKLMGFEQFGATRFYPATGVMGEAYMSDVARLRESSPRTYRDLFDCPLPPSAMATSRLAPKCLAYFARNSSVTDIGQVDAILRQVRGHGRVRRW